MAEEHLLRNLIKLTEFGFDHALEAFNFCKLPHISVQDDDDDGYQLLI